MKYQVVIVAAAAAGCSVFQDFTGYSSGSSPAPADAGPSADAPSEQPAPNDARSLDSGSAATFVDLFDRPDGVVGNDWLEKTPGAFKIVAGEVSVMAGSYQDLLLYRPMAEDVRNVEISTEFVFTADLSDCQCDPALVARLQHDVIPKEGTLRAYLAYIDHGTNLILGRHNTDSGLTVLQGVPLTTALTKGRYRLTLRVMGTSAVALMASAERHDGMRWTRLAEVIHTDRSPRRIEAAGSVGLTADDETPFRYDVFTRTAL